MSLNKVAYSIFSCSVLLALSAAQASSQDRQLATESCQHMLTEAIMWSDRSRAQDALNKGADINGTDGVGFTPLGHAIQCRDEEFAQWLIARGADVEQRDSAGRTSLERAVYKDSEAEIRMLTKVGAKVDAVDSIGCTPLHHAVVGKKEKAVRALIEAGADVTATDMFGDGFTPFEHAVKLGYTSIKLLLAERVDQKDGENKTLLESAAKRNDLPTLKLLVRAGANVNQVTSYGCSILEMPFYARDDLSSWDDADAKKTMQAIIDAGFDMRNNGALYLFSSEFDQYEKISFLLCAGMTAEGVDENGATPLHYAAETDCTSETMEALLRAGADATKVDNDGNTALHHAAFRLESYMGVKFINAGTDVSVRNRDGDTALDRVVSALQLYDSDGLNRGDVKDAAILLKALVRAKADVHAKNKASKTPLQSIVECRIANCCSHKELRLLMRPLLSVGAQPGEWLQGVAGFMRNKTKELLAQSYEKATSPRAEIIREWLDEQAESYMPADLQGLIGEFDGAPVSMQQVEKSLQQIKSCLGQTEQDEGPRRKRRRLN